MSMAYHSITNPRPKKISFNGILNSEYFFHRSGPIKLALNKDRVLKRNYYVKRARPKLYQGLKSKSSESNETEDSNISQDYRRNKTRIPSDLNKILLKYGKKFLIQNQKFYECKKDNDHFMNQWHSVNNTNKKKERKLMLKSYFNDSDKNSINYHSKQVKKMCENMFKTSPLLTGNRYNDIFFYYLNEFHQSYHDKKKKAYVKKKMISFLDKLKDLLDFTEVINAKDIDPITKDVKMKNSNYFKRYQEKVALENINNEIKQRKEDIKNIQESKRMIKNTSRTLIALEKNKNALEVDISPLYINRKIERLRSFISPNKSPYSNQNKLLILSENKTPQMNSTSSTGFFLSGKEFYKKKNNNKKIFSGLSKKSEAKKEDNSQSSIPKIPEKKEDKKEEQPQTPIQKYKYMFQKITPRKMPLVYNSPPKLDNTEKKSSLKPLENEKMTPKKSYTRRMNKNLTFKQTSFVSKMSKDNNKNFNKNLSSTKNINISKRASYYSQYQFNNLRDFSLNRLKENLKENNFMKGRISIGRKRGKTTKEKKVETIKQKDNDKSEFMQRILNRCKSKLMTLYDNIKTKKAAKGKAINMSNILGSKSQSDKAMKSLETIHIMDIIKKAKIITDKMDIEQKTKKVFQAYLPYEKIKKLEGIRDINRRVKALDISFVNQIINFKAKNKV